MRYFISKALSGLFALSLCLCIICFVVESVSFDVTYHMENIDIEAVKREIPVDDSQVKAVIDRVVQYIKGGIDNLQIELPGGRELFNEREITHMEDVQKLFTFCSNLKYVCIIFCMMAFICLFAINGFYCFKFMARGCVMIMLSMIGIIALVGMWYMIDFSGFWTAFHKMAFTNDLWLMMPDDALIILYSMEFFTAIVRRIIERLAVILGALLALSLLGWMFLPGKRGKRFGKKNFSD